MDVCTANLLRVGFILQKMNDQQILDLYAGDGDGKDAQMAKLAAIANRDWMNCGSPRLLFEEKHAAALMMTDGSPAALREVKMPFGSFLISFPDTLVEVPTEDRMVPIGNVLVHSTQGTVVAHFGDRSGLWASIMLTSLEHCGEFAGESKAAEIVSRLIVGACIEATRHRVTLMTVGPCSAGNGCNLAPVARRDPKPTNFTMTRPVKVDCRAALREYARSSGWSIPKSVQSLIRGHWKMQACGVGLTEHMLMFVEPHLRGNPHAPMAVRPHVFGGSVG